MLLLLFFSKLYSETLSTFTISPNHAYTVFVNSSFSAKGCVGMINGTCQHFQMYEEISWSLGLEVRCQGSSSLALIDEINGKRDANQYFKKLL